jgi:hypothetical protein
MYLIVPNARQRVQPARPPPVELEYVPAMQAVHAEDPAESHPGAPHRITAAVSASHIAAATPSGSNRDHPRALPSLALLSNPALAKTNFRSYKSLFATTWVLCATCQREFESCLTIV